MLGAITTERSRFLLWNSVAAVARDEMYALWLQGSFYMKAIVVAISSFQEVLFLDADQVVARDPTPLFDHPMYRKTGALVWKDFWSASWAPDVPALLGVSEDAMPSYSFESGQMLFDKTRFAASPFVVYSSVSGRIRLKLSAHSHALAIACDVVATCFGCYETSRSMHVSIANICQLECMLST
jgi:hypothetical protein